MHDIRLDMRTSKLMREVARCSCISLKLAGTCWNVKVHYDGR